MKRHIFVKFANASSQAAGSPHAFILAVLVIILWAVSGPLFQFSDTWQLVINTGTTIITFLMVFLIQNSQNRDTRALHLKIDELIRVTEGAHTALLDLEELSDEELRSICSKYRKIATESRKLMRQGGDDTHVPEIHLENTEETKSKPRRKRRRKS